MGKTFSIIVGGQTILLDVESDVELPGPIKNFELWRAQTYSTKEPDTLAWIDSFFQPGQVIYDIGANIGQYSLYAAKKLRGACQILAFEPESLNYAKLNRNIALNGLVGVIVPYCIAVTEHTGFEKFYIKTFAPGAALHALHRPVTQGEEAFAPQNQQGMMGISLDDLTGRFGLAFPNHLKIDVDGIEMLIVRGASRTLDNPALQSVLIEVYMYEKAAEAIRDIFLRHGFTLHNAASVTWKPGTAQNLIFRR